MVIIIAIIIIVCIILLPKYIHLNLYDKQLDLLADSIDEMIEEQHCSQSELFAVTDLNQNGRIEVLFADSEKGKVAVYEVNSKKDEIDYYEPNETLSNFTSFKLSPECYSTDDGAKYCYVMEGKCSNKDLKKGFFWIFENVGFSELATRSIDEDGSVHYANMNNTPISEEEYFDCVKNYFSGENPYIADIAWKTVSGESDYTSCIYHSFHDFGFRER